MATTVDVFFSDLVKQRFFEVYQFVRNPWAMQDNLRDNVQVIQQSFKAGTLKVPIDKALQDLGKAFQERLTLYESTVAQDPDLVQKAAALNIAPADVDALHALLKPTVDNLAVTTAKNEAELDAVVAQVLVDVPSPPKDATVDVGPVDPLPVEGTQPS